MRGFLLSGDEHFLDPYEVAKPRIIADLPCRSWWRTTRPRPIVCTACRRCTGMGQLRAIDDRYAARTSGDYRGAVKAGRGKRLTDEIRKQFDDAMTWSSSCASRATKRSPHHGLEHHPVPAVHAGISGFLAYVGRKNLLLSTVTAQTSRAAGQRARLDSKPGCAMARPSWLNRCWGN
jgi:hypothetical protein